MGLYRTALRLATLEALRPSALLKQGEGAEWPTLAQTRVFDSRIDPIEDLTADQHKAAIVVYTQEDLGYGSQHRGGAPFRRVVDLVFEISQIARADDDVNNRYVAGVPQTDAELEAELDRIEFEIELALLHGPGGHVFRQLTSGGSVTDPRSTPHRDSEEGARLAMRSLCWKVQVRDNAPELLPLTNKAGIERLPEPLRFVVKKFPESTYVAALGLGLGETMPMLPIATPLRTVTTAGEVIAHGAARTGVANVNGSIPLAGMPAAVVSDAAGSTESHAAVASDSDAPNETE